jgi:transposase
MHVRALPKDFPPWRTCYGFMARWAAAGIVGQIRDQLRKRIRREMGRAPGAVATVIDSQSVKAAETVGRDSRGLGRSPGSCTPAVTHATTNGSTSTLNH